jgi:anti-anti-sigma regulatory factor
MRNTMSQPSCLKVTGVKDVLIVEILGKRLFDSMAVRELTDELLCVIDGRKPRKLLVSFAEVGRCSTDVINALLLAKKRLLTESGELKLCDMSESIRHMCRILHLDGTVFRIYDSAADALDAFELDSTS